MVISQEANVFVAAARALLQGIEQQPLNKNEKTVILECLDELYERLDQDDPDSVKAA